jgi:transcriptional regulator with XRE-family HTH domain
MPKTLERADVLVGKRVRAYRLARRMSQSELGEKIGVTFQQIQKYEKGINRIGSGRLKKVASVLGVGIAALFAEGEGEHSGPDPLTAMLSQTYAGRLLEAFGAIAEDKQRLALVRLAEVLGERAKQS